MMLYKPDLEPLRTFGEPPIDLADAVSACLGVRPWLERKPVRLVRTIRTDRRNLRGRRDPLDICVADYSVGDVRVRVLDAEQEEYAERYLVLLYHSGEKHRQWLRGTRRLDRWLTRLNYHLTHGVIVPDHPVVGGLHRVDVGGIAVCLASREDRARLVFERLKNSGD